MQAYYPASSGGKYEAVLGYPREKGSNQCNVLEAHNDQDVLSCALSDIADSLLDCRLASVCNPLNQNATTSNTRIKGH